MPKGAAIEVYATTLHYAPCHVSGEGFRSVVVLSRDTNTDLDFVPQKERGGRSAVRQEQMAGCPSRFRLRGAGRMDGSKRR